MNRITNTFDQLQKNSQTAFMPFVVAGDPNFSTSLKILRLLTRSADVLEIGFPYSDPLADGPTIQAADERALKSSMNTDKVFDLILAVRKSTSIPISVLVYANLVFRYGINRFYQRAKQVGIDGILIPDIPVEESAPYLKAAKKYGIDQIFLVTPTTSPHRLKKILAVAQGYVYLVSLLGVTGARTKLHPSTLRLIKKIKKQTQLPVAVGFGISTADHVKAVTKVGVNGYIIGSALINIIGKHGKNRSLFPAIKRYIQTVTSPSHGS